MTTLPREARARAFKALHEAKPGFIMPNAWDAGSAIMLADAGFKAIATTSGGIAFSLGKPDYTPSAAGFAVSRAEMFARIREIVAAVALPVNGDLEAGYGDSPEAVAETIRMAIDAGLAGGNIEDKRPDANALYDEGLAVERIAAAREAIAAAGSAFVLTARTDALVWAEGNAIETCIRRANKFRVAGADCLFTPGPSDIAVIRRLVHDIDGPLNIVFGLAAGGSPDEWIAAGVQRVSTGGSMARAVLGFLRDSAGELRRGGAISFATRQVPQTELNALFERRLSGIPSPLVGEEGARREATGG
jgi:2-methylisocitrate lyase-like PEP mutase family enzyme